MAGRGRVRSGILHLSHSILCRRNRANSPYWCAQHMDGLELSPGGWGSDVESHAISRLLFVSFLGLRRNLTRSVPIFPAEDLGSASSSQTASGASVVLALIVGTPSIVYGCMRLQGGSAIFGYIGKIAQYQDRSVRSGPRGQLTYEQLVYEYVEPDYGLPTNQNRRNWAGAHTEDKVKEAINEYIQWENARLLSYYGAIFELCTATSGTLGGVTLIGELTGASRKTERRQLAFALFASSAILAGGCTVWLSRAFAHWYQARDLLNVAAWTSLLWLIMAFWLASASLDEETGQPMATISVGIVITCVLAWQLLNPYILSNVKNLAIENMRHALNFFERRARSEGHSGHDGIAVARTRFVDHWLNGYHGMADLETCAQALSLSSTRYACTYTYIYMYLVHGNV